MYRAAHIDELLAVPTDVVQGEWLPVRHPLGIRAFGANAYRGRAGEIVIEEHVDSDDELYVVLTGEADFRVGGDGVAAPAGTLVFVEPGTNRVARAVVDGTVVLAVGAPAGKAFEVSEWESSRLPPT